MKQKNRVSIIIGSKSDLEIAKKACAILEKFGIGHTLNISSAHRSHKRTVGLVGKLEKQGTEIFIACAGAAAHLPGVIAALTAAPVIGVPVSGSVFKGLDSLLAIVQMPGGIPVATVGVNSSANAALIAVQMLSLKDKDIKLKLLKYRSSMIKKIIEDDRSIRKR